MIAVERHDVADELEQAIAAELPVTLSYRKPGANIEPRTISPYELPESKAGDVSVLGWDHGREALRQFRLDRIKLVRRADDLVDFRPPTDP